MRRWAQNYFTGMFFAPNKDFVPSTPTGTLNYEDVQFPSRSGHALQGFFLKSKSTPLGTVVHCHGNTGSIHDHAPLVQFLSEAGCNVLVFDYGGYGQSVGHPTPPSIINDARSALDYCR